LAICSKNISILHHFHDITTFTVYVTTCDFEKDFSFENPVEITTGHMMTACTTLAQRRAAKSWRFSFNCSKDMIVAPKIKWVGWPWPRRI